MRKKAALNPNVKVIQIQVVSFLSFLPVVRPLLAELQGLQRRRLGARLTAELQAWLDAMKAHLESARAST